MERTADKKALLVVFLTVFIDLLGFGMVLPLLPVYARLFTADESGWVIGTLLASFSAMQFLFAPAWGRLSDSIGRRPVLMIGLAGSVLFYVVFGVASSLRSLSGLFIARIGAGICGATIPTAQAYIADVTPLRERARGMALIGAAFGIGFTFGPLIGAAALLGSTEHAAPRGAESASSELGQAAASAPHSATEVSPWPGYLSAALSGVALLLAWRYLPESLRAGSASAARRLFDPEALQTALSIPSMAILLFGSFVTVLAFANFESTLSLLLKTPQGHFQYDFENVLLVFAYVGLVLTLAQGLLVRRVAGKVPESVLVLVGGATTIIGYLLMPIASAQASLGLLLAALLIEVTGFAFLPTAINSLISRRSDPARQGGILGLNQSIVSLSRIIGPVAGVRLFYHSPSLPFWSAAVLMSASMVIVTFAAARGKDYAG